MREQGWSNGWDAPQPGGWDRRGLRPRYSAEDLAALMWRERVTMAVVFAVLFSVGTAAALTLPKAYTAHSSLLVKLGQEYVYQPRAGDAARGAIPQTGQVVQSEIEILSSDVLKRRVVKAVGLATIDPKLGEAWAGADPKKRQEIEAAAVKAITDGLKIETAPDTPVIRLSFKHKDPEAAALILNRLVATYVAYRREVFADVTSPWLAREKDAVRNRLEAADAAYEDFLRRNGVGDFASEKQSLSTVYQTVQDQRFKTDSDLREVESRLAALKARMGDAPQEIEIQRDLDLSAQSKLLQLRVDRQDLLSRYKPDAEPVRDLDARIAQLEALVSSGHGASDKDKRLGANPVWQDLEKQRIQLEAEAAALTRRRAELGRQLGEVTGRQQRLTGLESEYQDLAVERDVLQNNVRAFATRQAEDRAAQELARGDDSIRVVEQAAPPSEGVSLKKPAFILAGLFAAFTALCAGLGRVFTRKGFSTPGSAGRTLELPVLATAPLKTS